MCPLPRTANRRAFPRATCSISVCYGEEKKGEALAINVTREGISLISDHKWPVGTVVQLGLKLNDEFVPAQAIVRHRRADVTGLEFVRISIADRMKLDRAVFGSF